MEWYMHKRKLEDIVEEAACQRRLNLRKRCAPLLLPDEKRTPRCDQGKLR